MIALLLPALAKARQLAVRIQGASNLRQIGIALHEYVNVYRGQYPLAATANYNCGDANLGSHYNQKFAPLAGLTALFVSSYGYKAYAFTAVPLPYCTTPLRSRLGLPLCVVGTPKTSCVNGYRQSNDALQ
ncbi:MAG: hypothetical protein ACP5I8_03170 [Phycisphaerae bacterium]